MNRQYNSLFFVMGACLLLSLMYCPPYQVLVDDTEIFRYTGLAISRGLVPYRDFFDHKPPLIYFFNWGGILLGGPWGLWAINTILALAATWSLYNCCRKYRLPYPWLLPLLFNLLVRDSLISVGINMTREFTAFFMVFFFVILIGRTRFRYYGMGLFGALIFFTQQDQALPLIPFLIYVFLIREEIPLLSRFLGLGLGALTITLPVLIYFAFHHSLDYFWEAAFRFNYTTYITRHKSLGDHFRTIKRVLDAGNYEIPFMVALILGVFSLFLRNRHKGLVLSALSALILTLAPEFMGGRWGASGQPGDFSFYFLPLSAVICILLFTVFAFTEDTLAGRKAQAPYAVLLCCSLVYTALQHATHLVPRDEDPVIKSPELAYLQQQHPGDYQLYVFFDNPYIYCYNKWSILCPSRWIYQHFYMYFDNWDTDQKVLSSIASDLVRHRTKFVLMDASLLSEFRNPTNRDWWLSFMQTNYRLVPMPGGQKSILWQLKNNP